MIGNVTTNTITPVLTPAKLPSTYDKNVVAVSRLVDIPEFLVVTTTQLQRQERSGADRVRQEESRQAALRHGRRRQLSRTTTWLLRQKAGDLDMIAIHNKNGAAGMINDIDHRRHPGLVPQRCVDRGPDQSRQAAAARAGEPPAPARISRRADDAEIGYPGVGTIAWQGLFAPAGTPKEVLETIFKASVEALQAPPVVDAFKKQNFNIVPNKSLDDAKAWLADEIKTWKDITSQVKIEAARITLAVARRTTGARRPENTGGLSSCAGSDQCWCFALW